MELSEKWVKENKGNRFNVEMNSGVTLKNITFFISKCSTICYMNSRQKTRGQVFPYWDYKEVTKLEPKPLPTKKGNAKTLLNRLHPNVWDNLRKEFTDVLGGAENSDFNNHFDTKLKFRSMTSLLRESELESLKKAFENKTAFHWSRFTDSPQGRDLSIETKLGSDNIFRAWFSSEYMGCGNGDYYLLINPTTAVYYERD